MDNKDGIDLKEGNYQHSEAVIVDALHRAGKMTGYSTRRYLNCESGEASIPAESYLKAGPLA